MPPHGPGVAGPGHALVYAATLAAAVGLFLLINSAGSTLTAPAESQQSEETGNGSRGMMTPSGIPP